MSTMTREEIEKQKKIMYDKFSPRRRRFVDKIGYEEWDPFQLPCDPIDMRKDVTGMTSQQLCEEFCKNVKANRNSEYAQAAAEFGVTLVMNFERVRPIFDFCVWYNEHLEREGKKA